MGDFSFEYPSVFLLILIFIICSIWCKEKSRSIYFPHLYLLLLSEKKRVNWLNILKWNGIILAVTALASPVFKEASGVDYKNGKDIVVILDASQSMLDGVGYGMFGESKFDVAKSVIDNFIENRSNDRIGLVTFGDAAFVASPFTFDKHLLRSLLWMQQVGIAGARTAINDAISQSYSMLMRSKAKSKVAILLTDGMENQSIVEKNELISLMKKSNIKLYTIGFGDGYDKEYLEMLSSSGNGKSFEAKDAKTLQNIYDTIDTLEKSKLDMKPKIYTEHLFVYPLFLAWLSLIFYLYFKTNKEV